MEGKVTIIRLTMPNHPDIICIMKDVEGDEDSVELDRPHAIVANNREGAANNGMELSLLPYIPGYASETCTSIVIRKSDIFTTIEPVKELEQRFNVQFGSGIITNVGSNIVKVPTAGIGASLA